MQVVEKALGIFESRKFAGSRLLHGRDGFGIGNQRREWFDSDRSPRAHIEAAEHAQEAIERKATKIGVAQARKIGCRESRDARGATHGQFALVQDRDDAGGNYSLGLLEIRFGVS